MGEFNYGNIYTHLFGLIETHFWGESHQSRLGMCSVD